MNYEQVFQRQVFIEDWNQEEISKQIVMVLGVGGIGSVATTNLLRLGIKKLILIDYDSVDIHNLNRQTLYTNGDVGVQKIEAATKNLQFHNVGNTEIVSLDLDAVKNWNKIVELASECTAIFNCIDYGDYFDAAVQSLCLHFRIPMIIAGTFAQSFMAEIYIGSPCYNCLTDGLKDEYLTQIMKSNITKLESLTFLPSNNKPIGQSHNVLCSTAGNFATQLFINYINQLDGSNSTKKILFYLTTFEILNFPVESKNNCIICEYRQPKQIQQEEAQPQQIEQEQLNEGQAEIEQKVE